MSYEYRSPFNYVISKQGVITSGATDFMISRAPWPSPVNKYYLLRKVHVNSSATSGLGFAGGTFTMWDQDLSSATPTKRGSGGAPLFTCTIGTETMAAVTSGQPAIGVSGNSVATDLHITQIPRIPFYAGITVQAPIGTQYALELEVQ
jgi:hypothetical protein